MVKPQFEQLGKLVFESTNCPVCHSDDSIFMYSKKIREYTMTYVKCNQCQTLYTNPRATVESLRNLYASENFFEGKEDNVNYYSFIEGMPYLSRTAKSRLERVSKFANGKILLEVASAAGFFLKEAKMAGYDVQGVEFSKPMAEWSSKKWEVPVIADSIELVELPDGHFDVIASWGVMTIIRDPEAVIKKFNKALKPGGVWAFNTYYNESWWGRFWRKNWYILVLNTSQINSKKTLIQMIEKHGFELVSLRRDKPYASMKYLLFQLLSHFPGAVKNKIFDKLNWMNNFIFQVPLPDVMEFIWVKREDHKE